MTSQQQPVSSNTTSILITQIKQELAEGNKLRLEDSLAALIMQEPGRWRWMLVLEGIMPNPERDFSSKQSMAVIEAISNILKNEKLTNKEARDAYSLILSLLLVNTRLSTITKMLDELPFFNASKSTQIALVATFVESQCRIMSRNLLDEVGTNGNLNPIDQGLTRIASDGNLQVSISDSFERQCDIADLLMRYILWRNGADFGEIDRGVSPYNNPDFEKLLRLADAWLHWKNVWENVVFRGWSYKENDEVILFIPPDEQEFIRETVANLRWNLILSHLICVEPPDAVIDTDTPDRIQELARSLESAEVVAEWDGRIDEGCLAATVSSTYHRRATEHLISYRHYNVFLPMLRAVYGEESVDWQVWLDCREVLSVISDVFLVNVSQDDNESLCAKCMSDATIVPIPVLARLVASSTEHDIVQCEIGVRSLIFDRQRKGLDIWDQPLLPVGNDRCLLVPSFIQTGLYTRAIEHLIAAQGDDTPSARATDFVNFIGSIFKTFTDAKVQTELEIHSVDAASIEYDLIVWWDDHLILIEAKCLRSVWSPEDEFRAWKDVGYAIEQLQRRRDTLSGNWQQLRSNCPELCLPKSPPPMDKVICIALSNILQFSGTVVDDIIISDDLCFGRFFEDPEVECRLVGKREVIELGSAGRIRKEDKPTPAELRLYLVDPPQYRFLRESLTLVSRELPRRSEDKKAGILVALPENIPVTPESGLIRQDI